MAGPVLSAAAGTGALWTRWSLDPLVLGALVAAAWLWHEGGTGAREHDERWRGVAFGAGLLAIAVALVSPVEALAGVLASAHMVQHVLLVLVAPPLFALSRPAHRLLRGSPLGVRRAVGRWRGRARLTPPRVRRVRHPAVAWALAVATLWLWHAGAVYDAAVGNDLVHALEHLSLLATSLLFWSVIVGIGRGSERFQGLGILLVFVMGMQSVFLSLLLTFANEPWYETYLDTTQAFGLTPLADQQLAGVILWIPGGLLYAGAGVILLLRWLGADGANHNSKVPPSSVGGSSELRAGAAARRAGR